MRQTNLGFVGFRLPLSKYRSLAASEGHARPVLLEAAVWWDVDRLSGKNVSSKIAWYNL